MFFSWLAASRRLDRVTAKGQSLQDVRLTGGDLCLAPQSSRRHLNAGTAELSRQKCQMLFILSTSIIFDSCHTVKHNNVLMLLLHEGIIFEDQVFGGAPIWDLWVTSVLSAFTGFEAAELKVIVAKWRITITNQTMHFITLYAAFHFGFQVFCISLLSHYMHKETNHTWRKEHIFFFLPCFFSL